FAARPSDSLGRIQVARARQTCRQRDNRWKTRSVLAFIGPWLDQYIHLAAADHAFGVLIIIGEVEVEQPGRPGPQHFASFRPDICLNATASDSADERPIVEYHH